MRQHPRKRGVARSRQDAFVVGLKTGGHLSVTSTKRDKTSTSNVTKRVKRKTRIKNETLHLENKLRINLGKIDSIKKLTAAPFMRVSDYDSLVLNYEMRYAQVEAWLATIREYQNDAKEELYSSYLNLIKKEEEEAQESTTKRTRPTLYLFFPSPSMILCSDEHVYIYLRPGDNVPCYGPDQREWDITDPRLWPTSAKLKAATLPPRDVWGLICRHLSLKDIFAIASTCKQVCETIRKLDMWEDKKREILSLSPHVLFPSNKPTWKCFTDICRMRKQKYWKSTNMTKEATTWALVSFELLFPMQTNVPAQVQTVIPWWMPVSMSLRYMIYKDVANGPQVGLCVYQGHNNVDLFLFNGVRYYRVSFKGIRFFAKPFALLWNNTTDRGIQDAIVKNITYPHYQQYISSLLLLYFFH